MSFATGKDVMKCIKVLFRELWQAAYRIENLPASFPKITYQMAMSMYGSDKPDTRLGMKVRDHSA